MCHLCVCLPAHPMYSEKNWWHTWTSDILADDMCVDTWRLTEPDAALQCWQGMWTRCGKVIPLTVVFGSRWITSYICYNASQVCSGGMQGLICILYFWFICLPFSWPGKMLENHFLFTNMTLSRSTGRKRNAQVNVEQAYKSTSL